MNYQILINKKDMEQSVRFTFGKHSGKTVVETFKSDPSYIEWFLKQPGFHFKYRLIYQEITRLGAANYVPTSLATSTPVGRGKKDLSELEFTFGKHKGKTIVEVYQNDKSYIDWLTKQPDFTTKHKNIQEVILYCQNNNITKKEENNNHIDIHYGDHINFAESTIKIAMQKLDVNANFITNFLVEMKKINNINEAILTFVDNYVFNNSNNPEELKIILAWKYGICVDTFQTYFIDGIKKGITVDILIVQLTAKMAPEDKIYYLNNGTPIPRRICKSLPFLFTPAFFQLRLLGLKNKEISKIYRCQEDQVMFNFKINFPSRIEQISPFFKFDWRAEYYAFLFNPYAYYTINLLTCDSVIRSTERNVNNMKAERDLGTISRKIYENVKKNKWTCTPTWSIKAMNYENSIDILQDNYGLMFDLDSVYLRHIRAEEIAIAKFITDKMKTEGVDYNMIDNDEFQLSTEQVLAVKSAMSNPITVINALSGTGKTTIIKEIVRQITLDANKCNKFVICSFTAKAVKRVQEVLGHHVIIRDKSGEMISCVRTIHSLMNAIAKDTIERPEYIIIDESTMVSLSLFAFLVNLVHYIEFNLIMLGDINQLPPIKYGRPFEDMINSGQFETIKLTKNFRVKNGHDDPIIINSNNIINSMFYTVSPAENFILLNTKEESFENDIRMLIRHKGITVQNASHHKFITNTNDNNTKLNKIISEEIGNKIHKKAISCWMKDKKITMNYGIGDPVVFTKNNTYPGTFNGDQGVITGFSKEYLIVSLNGIKEEVIEDHENNKKKKKIDLSNIRIRLYRDRDSKCSGSCSCTGIIKNSCIQGCKCVCTCFYSVKNLLLAYSITVHKSQGSEYPSVYFYVDGAANKGFNNKRLSYTAITRAKEECMVIEGNVGLFECCSREAQSVHFGNLDQRIARIIEGEQKENREAEIKLINSILALVNRAPIVISK